MITRNNVSVPRLLTEIVGLTGDNEQKEREDT